ncbi:MAG: ABC transporter substrate-binding protein [Betaproteobacteria bacterium SG8_40]|jgi:TRAP-type mannitol/chloroaromatic compound transport system substrate-binding protein|nr:MAG: ABC transporter substrate-binding protein [Betaproteobacteria bacterium SG8_40]
MTDKSTSEKNKVPGEAPADSSRRQILKAGTLAGGALLLGAPHIRNAEAAKAQTWKVQSSWDAGTTGYKLFEAWANAFEEKSGGELAVKPFPAKAVAADNNALFDAVRTGVLQAMNPFTLYWSGKIPASVFLSSYPAGPDQTSHWDTMFYGLGMLEMTREIFGKFGLFYVGPIQHDANIIHSKKPVASLDQLKGMKIRLPGGMVSQVFEQFGVSTTSMPGSDIYPALEKGTIDAADYVGPAINLDLGFAEVTKYIICMGPPGQTSLYQPVDLMDLTVNMRAWKRLSKKMQVFVEEQVQTYSVHHFVTIQKANVQAMETFLKKGTKVSRLSAEDVTRFRKAAIPVWYEWARKNKDATRVFELQRDFMLNPYMGYLDQADVKGLKL